MSRISRSHNEALPATPRKETTASNDASARPPQHKSSNESLKKLPRRHQVSKSLRMTAVEQETLYNLPSRDRSQEALSTMPSAVNEDAVDCSFIECSQMSFPANSSPRDTIILSLFRDMSRRGLMGKDSFDGQAAHVGSHLNSEDMEFWEAAAQPSSSEPYGRQMRESVILNTPGADGVGSAVETADTHERCYTAWNMDDGVLSDEWVVVDHSGEN